MDVSNDELLAKIHKVSLYILLAFDKVCRENDLTYFLDSGTALGAVRHGGFIPWDDDVDVGMPRKDYERFLQIGQENLPEDLFLQTRDTDPAYKRHAAKLRLKGTVFQEYEGSTYEQNGFFIDIFPFDNIPKNECLAKLDITISRLLYRIICIWRSPEKSPKRYRRWIAYFVKKLPASMIRWLENIYICFCRKLEKRNTGHITCYFWLMTQQKSYIFDVEKMFPVEEIMFEGQGLKIMRDPDYYLTTMYGDYRIPPPKKMRFGHHMKGKIDFGKYA